MAKTSTRKRSSDSTEERAAVLFVADRVVLSLQPEERTELQAALSRTLNEMDLKAKLVPTKLLVLQDIPHQVGFGRFASGLRGLAETLFEKGQLTERDFQSAPRFLTVSDWEKRAKDSAPEMPTDKDSAETTTEKLIATLDRKFISSYAPSFLPTQGTSWPFENGLPGLTVLIGGTGSGKTYRAIRCGTEILVRFSERLEAIDLGREIPGVIPPTVLHALSLPHAIELSLYAACLNARTVLDSLRGLVLKMKGAAGSGGLIPESFLVLTDINNLFVDFGVSIIATLNPMSPTSEVASVDWTESSVAGMIHLERLPRPGTVSKVSYCHIDGRTMTEGATSDRPGSSVVDRGFVESSVAGRHADNALRGDGTMISEDRMTFLSAQGLRGAAEPFADSRVDAPGVSTTRGSADFSNF